MNDISDLSFTITPRSDQLNADDLIVADKIITVTEIRRGPKEHPVIIRYQGDDGRPYKPCKSMRRVLIFAWGKDGNAWIGRSMTLYCDPSVKYAGQEVGGIRISHLSDIKRTIVMKLTATRGRKADFKVDVLKVSDRAPYPADLFDKGLDTMKDFIQSGQMTTEQVIARCEQTGTLTEEQRKTIRDFEQAKPAPEETPTAKDDELENLFGDE